MNADFNTRLHTFALSDDRPDAELTPVLANLVSKKVYNLSALLSLDLVKLKSWFEEEDADFLLRFIRSLPLDDAVLKAIGLSDSEDVEKIVKSKYKEIADLLDRFKSEVAIEQAFSIEPPASSSLWKFVERFTRAPGKIIWRSAMFEI